MKPDVPDAPQTLRPQNGSPAFYVASDIKCFWRTKTEIERIKAAIIDILRDHPQTVRQIFYALTVRGVIKKAEIEYQRTVIRLLTDIGNAYGYRLIASGELDSYRDGRARKITVKSIHTYVKRRLAGEGLS